ncbi:DedA family protein [Goodfellowiella coeruleoviolacea]|uniref:Membrane protein DedA, SNARE-associated domain n=1 Tax=Goodfellowiella coeruleoviolacea TaxID=334858 RepID=A0AAE3GEQ3_9PSEU|nr:DedA family protein [Goodfellowiella coeruleoviolacea]MCP2166368.1 membrane protein DedA, SNARE-associated domain [Goodfellowiella coeruleoviolacea]
MALLTGALEALADLPPAVVVVAAGAFAFGECALGLGFLVPGEAALLVVATTVTSAPAFLVMWLVVAVCAAAGNSVGYLLGRRYGNRLRDSRIVRRLGQQHWDRAGDLLHRTGGRAVLVGMFMPVARTLLPAAAGAARLPLRRYLPSVVAGALGWSALHIGIGMAAGASAKYVEQALGTASWVVIGAIAVTAGIVLLVRRRRAQRLAAQQAAEQTDERDLEVVP